MCQYHYRVYIIELKKTVLEDRHFLERNPWYEEGKPCVYVGSCVFQTKPATDSRRSLPPIPRECCHSGSAPESPTVAEYLRRANEAGVSWPLPAELDDTRLERLLFPPPPDLPAQIREAQIFVAVLVASNYTFAEATWTQGLPDWIGSHGRALRFLGGVPKLVVPDNLRSGASKAHRYEPDTNPTYQDMASHYGVAVLPTRVRRPRDKAKVKGGVLVVER